VLSLPMKTAPDRARSVSMTNTRLSDGFKNVVPSIMIFVTYTVSFVLFTATLPLWPLSIAYAIWSGAGTALTAVVGECFAPAIIPSRPRV
jgi:multidrug transporter EmrE-like cation transporter